LLNRPNLIPRSPTHTTNVVEFLLPEEIVHFEREFVEAQQAAYVETAIEDNVICDKLDPAAARSTRRASTTPVPTITDETPRCTSTSGCHAPWI